MVVAAEVVPLHLADVALPGFHPRHGEPCPVFAFLIRHPEGALLVDTGVGQGHPGIDELYSPVQYPIVDALVAHGIRVDDIAAVINTHLHFDHCGENRHFPGRPIYVQRAEYEAAQAPAYTVSIWVDFEGACYELVDSEREVLPGVTLIPTPGHTPGHQSVLVETGEGRAVIAGHGAYSAAEFAGEAAPSGGEWDNDAYAASLGKLRELQPNSAHFSHDATIWTPTS